LYRRSSISNFVYSYYTAHKDVFLQFANARELNRGFRIDEKLWKEFGDYVTRDSADISKLPPKEKEFISQKLLESFARQVWRMEGLTEVRNSYDPEIKKALNELNKQ
jgi:hypothetical protein